MTLAHPKLSPLLSGGTSTQAGDPFSSHRAVLRVLNVHDQLHFYSFATTKEKKNIMMESKARNYLNILF